MGDIEYCISSHQEKLIELTRIPREELMKSKNYAIKDLSNMTGCISLWFDRCELPDEITHNQYKSYVKLLTIGYICCNVYSQ